VRVFPTFDTVSTGVRRAIAITGSLLALCIFTIVGDSLWVIMIVRAVPTFAFAVFVSAIKTSGHVDAARQKVLHDSISFFPTGLQIIATNFQMLWQGTIPPAAERVATIHYSERLLDIVLALIFSVVIAVIFLRPYLLGH
jgi:hypothetical protein